MRKGKLAREDRVGRAALRVAERLKRTPQQQLELLDSKLGKGVGARKERARLSRVIEGDGEVVKATKKVARTRADRRKEKAAKHARRQHSGN